ncbi:hypothetical protein ACPCG0_11730 [Propionibacteriaceae bacterium Y1923]|uniref:hypothetical protein n=1 Tax=Aestuariimicrobium sp. Y1814 TaxID=3418742 RepID=UPI003C154727
MAGDDLEDAVADLLMHQTLGHGRTRWIVAQRESGGWDVALVIDGGYSDRADADEVADFWDALVDKVLAALEATA